ncbi:MAG TPA: glucuronate isomerase [Bacilli bacterium]
MKQFLDDRFLLTNDTAVALFQNYAQNQPIIDYHCHLSPQEIYHDKQFRNLAEVWLYGDHYKWRAMRANGVAECLVTGGEGVSDYDRFVAWAKTVPATLGNPLFHWSHLELQRIFGIDELINEENAPQIWAKANTKLNEPGFSVRDLIRRANVEVLCTTDDPADSLEYHVKLKEAADLGFRVLPSFRPDKALEINRKTFLPWIKRLGEAAGGDIASYADLLQALDARLDFFHRVGGRISDHALDYVPYAEATEAQAAEVFAKALRGESISREEENRYKTYTLLFLGRRYAELNWTMQLHINAHRNNNTRMFAKLGPDTGYDSIHDNLIAEPLTRLLDKLDQDDALPRTILYSLNARDNDVLASLIGSFQGGGIPGKMQLGAAWWFNDTKGGMLKQMNALAENGLLSRFVGMLTDSRSFLSYTRHEYFRRILCSLLGEWAENGEAPNDLAWLGGIVADICYGNAKRYFQF